MTKVFRMNGFDRKKQILLKKIAEKGEGGYIVNYRNPVEVKIADFDARLHDELLPKTIHIDAAMNFGGSLKLSHIEDLGSIGLCLSDLYDGDDMLKLADAIE